MKKIIISLLTLAALVVGAQAQGLVTASVSPVIYNSVTTNMAGTSTIVIDVRRQQNVAIEWTQTLNGAGSTVGGLAFVPSLDGSTLASSPHDNGFSIVRAPNGTTPVVTITNFNVKGYNYLVCHYITNGSAALMTNTVRYWVKPNAP
jgi:hypothetical protein